MKQPTYCCRDLHFHALPTIQCYTLASFFLNFLNYLPQRYTLFTNLPNYSLYFFTAEQECGGIDSNMKIPIFLGFGFFLLYLCIAFSNNVIRGQEKFTPTREIYIRDCGGRRTTLWRVSRVFVAPATIVYDARHKPDIVNLFSHFC